jgi:large conductance mechanosensitive channel
MIKGFKEFLMRGNLIELAVAFVMAAAFGAVVTAMVKVVMDIIGEVGGTPNFSDYAPGGVHIGLLLTTLITFITLAAVVYFLVVTLYQKATERFGPADEPTPLSEDTQLLTEIRDLLAQQRTS